MIPKRRAASLVPILAIMLIAVAASTGHASQPLDFNRCPPLGFNLSDVTITYGWSDPPQIAMVRISGKTGVAEVFSDFASDSLRPQARKVIPDSSIVRILQDFQDCHYFMYPDTVYGAAHLSHFLDAGRQIDSIPWARLCEPICRYQITLRIGQFEKHTLFSDVIPSLLPMDLAELRRRLEAVQRPEWNPR
jgi:hypothetical protein